MSFKEEYTELQNSISPDAEFLEQLARKMDIQKQEQEQKKTNRKKPLALFIPAAILCAGAAAAVIVVSGSLKPRPVPAPAPVNANTDKLSYTVGVFAEKETFSENAPIPEQLSQMLADNETVLYKSSENKFDASGKMNDEQRAALSKKIKNASETGSEIGKNAEYYMAVLESGDVIKFRISGDIIAVNEKFYKIP